jgi:hypothetical protein
MRKTRTASARLRSDREYGVKASCAKMCTSATTAPSAAGIPGGSGADSGIFTEDESSPRGGACACCDRAPDVPPVAKEEMSDMTPGMAEDSPLSRSGAPG